MTQEEVDQARMLVERAREAARHHGQSWRALVPDPATIDLAHEAAEEHAYTSMAAAKAALRAHIRQVYGISLAELTTLASG